MVNINIVKGKNKILWISGIILVVLILFVIMRIKEIGHVPSQELSPWALNTATVELGTVSQGFPVLAKVSTNSNITITGQISGTIIKMGPREGMKVKAGDFLAQIDTREIKENIAGLQAKLKSAKAQVALHKDELAREQKLFDEGGSSATALEIHKTAEVSALENVRALERQIDALTVRKEYGRVTAPTDGIIATRLREPGDVCMPGHPLYKLTEAKGARILVSFPQEIIEDIEPNSELELYHGKDTMIVHLNRIFPSVDAFALGKAEADLDVTPFGLSSGARVAGRIILDKRTNSSVIPHGSYITGEKNNISKVFKIVNRDNKNYLQMIPINVELIGRNNVAVSGEIFPQDKIVVAHESVLQRLKDGDPVTIVGGIQ